MNISKRHQISLQLFSSARRDWNWKEWIILELKLLADVAGGFSYAGSQLPFIQFRRQDRKLGISI